ncbi:hypothetical protein QL285_077267 [Trifolium repens]|nr:hypothetical protein QL285_077267 [Trifolium repens]
MFSSSNPLKSFTNRFIRVQGVILESLVKFCARKHEIRFAQDNHLCDLREKKNNLQCLSAVAAAPPPSPVIFSGEFSPENS